MMSMQSGDADEPRQQITGGIPQKGTAELSGSICIQEQPCRPISRVRKTVTPLMRSCF